MVVRNKEAGSPISRDPVELETPNFTRTSIPTGSTFTPDMASLTTAGRSDKPPQTALGRILVVRHFACPTNWLVFCLKFHDSRLTILQKFDQKLSEAVFSTVFLNFHKC